MTPLLFQIAGPGAGFNIDPAWVISMIMALLSMLTGTIAFLYRGQIAAMRERITWLQEEGHRKDERTDRLIQQIGRAANAVERSVSLAEKERTPR